MALHSKYQYGARRFEELVTSVDVDENGKVTTTFSWRPKAERDQAFKDDLAAVEKEFADVA